MSQPIAHRAGAIHVESFVEKRVTQIASLLQMVDNAKLVSGEVTKGPRTAAQRLPRHMRRRAMSYDVRRMPKRLRNFAAAYINSKHRKKPPSRFARRRPRNLLSNYIRRQRKDVWLETHIWHAKRFHMATRWGYKLPLRSFQRAFRPIYRASVRGCAVRDMSYLTCLLLRSPDRNLLISSLSPLFMPGCGPSPAFLSAQEGLLEVSALVYNPREKPLRLIGPIRFSWMKEGDEHILSIWVHPSCRDELLTEVIALLSLERTPEEETDSNDSECINERYSEKLKTEAYRSKSSGIKVENLRDQLNRIRLFGPNSLNVARDVLQLCASDESERYAVQHDAWKAACSKGECQSGSLFTLLIEDPRISRPSKKFVPKNLEVDVEEMNAEEKSTQRSTPIPDMWSRAARLDCLQKRLPDAKLNSLRSEKVGQLTDTPAKIPVTVIVRGCGGGRQRPLDGVEIIVPAGFGVDLWVACQMRGARASGIMDHCSAHLEAGQMCFPFDDAHSKAFDAEAKRICEEKRAKELARPYNRRVQFWSRLSVKYPFEFEWNELCKDWGATGDAYVLRDRRALVLLSQWLKGEKECPDEVLKQHPNALLPVVINATSRGRPKRYGLLCVPTVDDLKSGKRLKLEQRPRWEHHTVDDGDDDSEEEQVDEEMQEPDQASSSSGAPLGEHVLVSEVPSNEKPISLKDMFVCDVIVNKAQKRKLINKKKKERVKRRKIVREEQLAEFNREESEKEETPYRYSASREVVGRLVRGQFSFFSSRGVGNGYIPLAALSSLPIQGKRRVVLMRNVTSKYYHQGTVDVLMAPLEI